MSDFAVTRKRMEEWTPPYHPPCFLFLFSEMKKPDKLVIRKVIWQAVQRAFTSPLEHHIALFCAPVDKMKGKHMAVKTRRWKKNEKVVYWTLAALKETRL